MSRPGGLPPYLRNLPAYGVRRERKKPPKPAYLRLDVLACDDCGQHFLNQEPNGVTASCGKCGSSAVRLARATSPYRSGGTGATAAKARERV